MATHPISKMPRLLDDLVEALQRFLQRLRNDFEKDFTARANRFNPIDPRTVTLLIIIAVLVFMLTDGLLTWLRLGRP